MSYHGEDKKWHCHKRMRPKEELELGVPSIELLRLLSFRHNFFQHRRPIYAINNVHMQNAA